MRLKVLLGAAVASIFMVFATSAVAGLPPAAEFRASQALDEPLNTNIPYLAWLGEEVRLVKCYDPQGLLRDGVINASQVALVGNSSQFAVDFDVITWSGDPHFKPIVEEASTRIFRGTGAAHRGDTCVSVDVYSSKPGLAQIELAVNLQGFVNNGSSLFDKHTFLVGWMAILDTKIDEIACNEFGAPFTAGVLGSSGPVCRLSDPLGDGNFGNADPTRHGGRVRAEVRGIIPTDQDSFAGLFDGGDLVLPDEYREMANVLAEDSLPNNAGSNDIARWDIHDDEALTEGHLTEVNGCTPDVYDFDQNPDTTNDSVDNCLGDFSFSRIFPGAGSFTGPFDPTLPATLLSDGKVDRYDAPMPSIRLDFTSTGTFGSFAEVFKREVYSRDRQGGSQLHNLYAPYYLTWLPATERPVSEASGIAGPRHINNAEGFLDGGRIGDGRYEYWRFAAELSASQGSCLLRDPAFLGGAGRDAIFRRIAGPRRVALYTDEHGIAYIDVRANTGIASIPEANINENGGCDIQGLPLSTRISAVAKYPYKPIPGFRDGVPAQQTLTKTLGNLFQKGISCRPKVGPGVPNIFVCTVFAIDFDGTVSRFGDNPNTPLVNEGEVVCLTTGDNVDDVQLDNKFAEVSPPSGLTGRNLICTRLNSKGQAIFEPEGSGGVNALFVEEELKRITTLGGPAPIVPATPVTPVVTPVTPVTPAAPVVLPSNNTQAQNPAPATTSVVVSLAGAPVPSAAAAQPTKTVTVARATLQSAKLVAVNGKRALVVRVTSTAKVAKIQLRLINKAGKVTKFVRTVTTNKVVRVPNLVIPKGITRVSVSVL